MAQNIESVKETIGLLKDIPKRLSHQTIIPLNSVAYLHTKIVNTNEVYMSIGADYFANISVHQSIKQLEKRCNIKSEQSETKSKNDEQSQKVKEMVKIVEEKDQEWKLPDENNRGVVNQLSNGMVEIIEFEEDAEQQEKTIQQSQKSDIEWDGINSDLSKNVHKNKRQKMPWENIIQSYIDKEEEQPKETLKDVINQTKEKYSEKTYDNFSQQEEEYINECLQKGNKKKVKKVKKVKRKAKKMKVVKEEKKLSKFKQQALENKQMMEQQHNDQQNEQKLPQNQNQPKSMYNFFTTNDKQFFGKEQKKKSSQQLQNSLKQVQEIKISEIEKQIESMYGEQQKPKPKKVEFKEDQTQKNVHQKIQIQQEKPKKMSKFKQRRMMERQSQSNQKQ